jgi:Flp pilus assembly pilin Flp
MPSGGRSPYRERIMNWIRIKLRRVWLGARDQRGAVATEYGLILTLVVLVIVIAVAAFGVSLTGLFEQGPEAFPAS